MPYALGKSIQIKKGGGSLVGKTGQTVPGIHSVKSVNSGGGWMADVGKNERI